MIALYFGNIGSGKSTIVTYFCKKYKKMRFKDGKGLVKPCFRHVVTNLDVDIKNVNVDDFRGLGDKYTYPPLTLVLVDEASIVFNNRNTLNMSPAKIEYFKKSRHDMHDVYLFSQSWDDVDITLRRLCKELWYIRKVGPWTIARKVEKIVDVPNADTSDENKDIKDGYRFVPLWHIFLFEKLFKVWFRPKYYRFFDSFSHDDTRHVKRLS